MSYSSSGTENAPNDGGLGDVCPDAEVLLVEPGDHVGSGEAQHLVAALERFATEVVGREVEALHVRAERAVIDDHTFVDEFEVGRVGHDPARVLVPRAAAATRLAGSGAPRRFAT